MSYRRSKKVGPLRFTVSQRGISTSIGGGPLRITHGADGKVRRLLERRKFADLWMTRIADTMAPVAAP